MLFRSKRIYVSECANVCLVRRSSQEQDAEAVSQVAGRRAAIYFQVCQLIYHTERVFDFNTTFDELTESNIKVEQ